MARLGNTWSDRSCPTDRKAANTLQHLIRHARQQQEELLAALVAPPWNHKPPPCQIELRPLQAEQPFAAGWSACFEGAMAFAARKMRIAVPADLARYIEIQA